jgi:hypothetical protein
MFHYISSFLQESFSLGILERILDNYYLLTVAADILRTPTHTEHSSLFCIPFPNRYFNTFGLIAWTGRVHKTASCRRKTNKSGVDMKDKFSSSAFTSETTCSLYPHHKTPFQNSPHKRKVMHTLF